MKKLLFFLLFPSMAFADRLGALNSSAQVMLSTQGITNTSSLQTGATFYVSSGTVSTILYTSTMAIGTANDLSLTRGNVAACTINGIVVAGCGNNGGALKFNQSTANSSLDNAGRLSLGGIGPNQLNVLGSAFVGTTAVYPLSSQAFFEIQSSTTPSNMLYVSTAITGGNSIAFSTTGAILINGSAGTSGQAITSGGSGAVTSWTTISGGGSGGYAVAPATVQFNLAQGVTGTTFTFTGPAQSTVTYGLTVGSFTVNGSSAGQFQLTEGLDGGVFAPASGKDNFWASSSSHAFVTNYNGSSSTGTLVVSTGVVTVGNCVKFGSQGSVVDSGAACGTGSGGSSGNITNTASQAAVAYYSAAGSSNTLSGSNTFQFNGTSVTVQSSMTVSFPGGVHTLTPGFFDIYHGNAVTGQYLLTIGSNLLNNQVIFPDHQAINATNYGIDAGALQVGDSTFGTSKILSNQSSNSFIDFFNSNGGFTFQTGGAALRDFTFNPETVTTVVISSSSFVITSSASVISPATDKFSLRVSTSATSGIYALAFATNSHIIAGGVTPSTSSCGTGGGIVGTDTAGTVTGGTGSTGCTLTFAQPFKNDPVCVISEQTGSVVNALSYTHSVNQLVVTQTGLGTGKFDYFCIGVKE